MNKDEEILLYLEKELSKEKTLKSISEKFDITELSILGYIYTLKEKGINIDYYEKNGEAYVVRNDYPNLAKENVYRIGKNNFDNVKFAVISDLRFGSKYEQIEILNDMYLKFLQEGIQYVFIIGNLLEGKYSGKTLTNFGKSLISNDAIGQCEHFINYFPKVEGIKTFFITGELDHLWGKVLNVGEYISLNRPDLTYLGPKSCTIYMNNTALRLEQLKNGDAYTYAYPHQKYSRSMSSNEEYNAIFLSGARNFQHFPNIRDTQIFSIPSVTQRTPRMAGDSTSNTMGAYLFELKFNKFGKIERLIPTVMPYFNASHNSYLNIKQLNVQKDNNGDYIQKKKVLDDKKYFSSAIQIYRSLRKEERFSSLLERLELSEYELYGIINYLQNIGYDVTINNIDGELVVCKKMQRKVMNEIKPSKEELHVKIFGVVSDTHYGNILCQPSMVNTFCYEAYNRGIDMMFHIGDISDGDYSRIRPNHIHEVFLYGATGQLDYTVKTLPKYPGMNWYGITGSHDETHLFNYGMNFGEELAKRRKDFTYLGQDQAIFNIDNCPIELFHPGGGTSRILSTKPQNGIDQLPSKTKPNLSLRGHYHKVYYMLYRNIHTFLCPCNVDQSKFMLKNEIPNIMGDYFITIYYDDDGHIHYVDAEPMIFSKNDVRERDYENPRKNMRNKILTKNIVK